MTQKKKFFTSLFFICSLLFCIIFSLPLSLDFILSQFQSILGKTLRRPEKWHNILRTLSFVGMYFVSVTGFLTLTNVGRDISISIKTQSKRLLTVLFTGKGFHYYTVTAFLFFLCFYKIIDSDILYRDDVFRHVTGNRSWIEFSRYVSEFLSMVLHTGITLSDIAPLSLFIAIAVMAFSTLFISFIVANDLSFKNIFIFLLVFICPFYAQNVSYRFDAPYMALAVLFSIIPFAFTTDKRTFFFMSFFCLNLCNMTYQAASSIYILLAIYKVYQFIQENTDKKEYKFFIANVVFSYAVSLLFFKLFLMVPMLDQNTSYFSSRISLFSIPINLIFYIKTVFSLFGGKWIKFFFLIVLIFSLYESVRHSRQKILVSVCLTIITFSLALCLSFGPYIIFERPLMSPRAFMGFNFFVALVSFNSVKWTSEKFRIIPVALLVYGCFVFYYAYGNALRDQKLFQDFRTELLISDLNKFANNASPKKIFIEGNVGLSKGFSIAVKNFPVIKQLVPVLPAENSSWNDEILNFYNFNCEEVEKFDGYDTLPLLIDSNYHIIYGNDNCFYIIFKDGSYR